MTLARRRVRLVHASDLHIGDDAGESLRPAERVARMAGRTAADAVLVCGDLFDHGRVSDTTVRDTLAVLAGAGVPVVVLPGNHDPLGPGSVYLRDPPGDTPAHLHVVRDRAGGFVDLLDGALVVWARPTVEHSPAFRPLATVPARPPGGGWYVVAAHGHFLPVPAPVPRSSTISPEDVQRIDADYVALGHWHLATQISASPPAWYSGWPRAAGPPGGALQVDLVPGEPAVVTPIERD